MTHKRTPHVLLVEDEPGDAHLMKLALKKNGFQLELDCVNDGEECLDYLMRRGERFHNSRRPDLIFLDHKMPGKGGLETLCTIKGSDSLRAIPVVVVTTSALEADVAASYYFGAAGYISKPADMNEFVAAIRTLGQYWFSLVRLPERIE